MNNRIQVPNVLKNYNAVDSESEISKYAGGFCDQMTLYVDATKLINTMIKNITAIYMPYANSRVDFFYFPITEFRIIFVFDPV